MPVIREDPYGGYNFLITVTGVSDDGTAVKGSFSEISGLETELSPIEYRNGSEDITVRKIAGLKKFTNITGKRGITADLDFWNWILAGLSGKIKRADGSVVLLDENRQEVLRWNFRRGWACKYTGPGLNAANNEIAMETLEICHEGLSIDGQG
jgi:phage tail-like protein